MTPLVCSLVAGGFMAVAATVAAPARAQPAQEAVAQAAASARASSDAGDVAALLDDALAPAALRPAQVALLDRLGDDLDAKLAVVVQTRRALLVALGAQTAAGAIDVAELEPQLRAFLDASAVAAPALRAEVQHLHDTLDPPQRALFIAGLRRALDERSASAAPSTTLARWTRALELEEWQQRVLRAVFEAEAAGSRRTLGRTQRMLDAFGGASFQLDEALPRGDARARAEQVASEILETTALVTRVLTPAQRAAAAHRLAGDGFGGGFASGLGGVFLF